MEYLWRSDALSVAERHQLAQGLNRTAYLLERLGSCRACWRAAWRTRSRRSLTCGTKRAGSTGRGDIRARAENQVRQLNNERREANMREFTAQESADQLQRSVDEITAMEIKRLEDARDAARKSADEFEARLASAPDEGMPDTPQDLIPETPGITKAQAIAAGKHVKKLILIPGQGTHRMRERSLTRSWAGCSFQRIQSSSFAWVLFLMRESRRSNRRGPSAHGRGRVASCVLG